MEQLNIQFLVFDGCPLADAARQSLEAAVKAMGIGGYEEIDLLDLATPESLRVWGSPTILVNDRDVCGSDPGDGVGCRVYPGLERVPSAADIAAFIKRFLAES